MEDIPYIHSIMTTVFTKDGKILVVKNDKGSLDSFPQYFLGKKDNRHYPGENGIDILNDEIDYPEAISYFLLLKSKSNEMAVKSEFYLGNPYGLTDCGILYDKTAPAQIKEMKEIKETTFIRVGRDCYEIRIGNRPIINEIQTRYVVVPNLEEADYPTIKEFTITELEQLRDSNLVDFSGNLLWQMSGENLEKIKEFSSNLSGEKQRNNERKIIPFQATRKK